MKPQEERKVSDCCKATMSLKQQENTVIFYSECDKCHKKCAPSPQNRPGDGRENWESRMPMILTKLPAKQWNAICLYIQSERQYAMAAYRDAIMGKKKLHHNSSTKEYIPIESIERVSGEFGL